MYFDLLSFIYDGDPIYFYNVNINTRFVFHFCQHWDDTRSGSPFSWKTGICFPSLPIQWLLIVWRRKGTNHLLCSAMREFCVFFWTIKSIWWSSTYHPGAILLLGHGWVITPRCFMCMWSNIHAPPLTCWQFYDGVDVIIIITQPINQ